MSMKQLSDFTAHNIITDKTGVEAGYVNDPKDSGGATHWGVTEATANEPQYRDLWKKYGWDGNMETMPQALAYDIYKRGWWDKMSLDRVSKTSPILCDRLFDFGINAGRGASVKALQRLLNVFNSNGADYPDIAVDGGLGGGTCGALEAYAAKRGEQGIYNLILFHIGEQSHHYVDVSEEYAKNERFTNGWANRVARDTKVYGEILFGS